MKLTVSALAAVAALGFAAGTASAQHVLVQHGSHYHAVPTYSTPVYGGYVSPVYNSGVTFGANYYSPGVSVGVGYGQPAFGGHYYGGFVQPSYHGGFGGGWGGHNHGGWNSGWGGGHFDYHRGHYHYHR